ncbi:hypothetical protein Bbelb_062640 [Branchiostoma belcheri]|nr:hypothetical protein Bbelb_062640 [Branchiostoma belcheri]
MSPPTLDLGLQGFRVEYVSKGARPDLEIPGLEAVWAELIPPSLQFVKKATSTFTFSPITVEFVTEQLSAVKIKKATGLDNIDNRLLKVGAQILAPSLTKLFNRSLDTGKFPTKWKQAKVLPIHKKGDKTSPSNYRPVSILPAISKILERAVHNQLYDYFNKNKLLTQSQSGFRKAHSCETALHSVVEDWIESMDKKQQTGVIFCDLSRAFDTLDHDIMLLKLKIYGTHRAKSASRDLHLTLEGTKGGIDKLQKLQNRAGRVILGCDHYTPSDTILHRLGWTPVIEMHKRNKAVLVYKALHDMSPPHISAANCGLSVDCTFISGSSQSLLTSARQKRPESLILGSNFEPVLFWVSGSVEDDGSSQRSAVVGGNLSLPERVAGALVEYK